MQTLFNGGQKYQLRYYLEVQVYQHHLAARDVLFGSESAIIATGNNLGNESHGFDCRLFNRLGLQSKILRNWM